MTGFHVSALAGAPARSGAEAAHAWRSVGGSCPAPGAGHASRVASTAAAGMRLVSGRLCAPVAARSPCAPVARQLSSMRGGGGGPAGSARNLLIGAAVGAAGVVALIFGSAVVITAGGLAVLWVGWRFLRVKLLQWSRYAGGSAVVRSHGSSRAAEEPSMAQAAPAAAFHLLRMVARHTFGMMRNEAFPRVHAHIVDHLQHSRALGQVLKEPEFTFPDIVQEQSMDGVGSAVVMTFHLRGEHVKSGLDMMGSVRVAAQLAPDATVPEYKEIKMALFDEAGNPYEVDILAEVQRTAGNVVDAEFREVKRPGR